MPHPLLVQSGNRSAVGPGGLSEARISWGGTGAGRALAQQWDGADRPRSRPRRPEALRGREGWAGPTWASCSTYPPAPSVPVRGLAGNGL